jgi:putative phage-type endonuclease
MNAQQRTAEWYTARVGCVTASRFADVMTNGRSKSQPWGDTAMSYAYELAGARLVGYAQDDGGNMATQWGCEHEADALRAYQIAQSVLVEDAVFIRHPLVEMVGASPDGLVGDDGLVEAKCPWTTREHVRAIYTQEMPDKHKPQVQGQLWVTSRLWCDFVSYDPRCPEECRLFIARVERDDAYIEQLADRVEAFAALVSKIERECRGK